ncbi:MAG: hypothetical protein JAZ19_15550 [Candidatus Thiodiazotropha taylori]|nr:hypothetical protein [Candidatus Thiodiazotropha taylori]
MSHENINTLIASIGLLIALVTAWHQFGPAPDELDIEVTGKFEFSTPFESLRPFPKINGGPERIIAGPVFWEAVLYNKLDRPLLNIPGQSPFKKRTTTHASSLHFFLLE